MLVFTSRFFPHEYMPGSLIHTLNLLRILSRLQQDID
jgi:hypothetical protein